MKTKPICRKRPWFLLFVLFVFLSPVPGLSDETDCDRCRELEIAIAAVNAQIAEYDAQIEANWQAYAESSDQSRETFYEMKRLIDEKHEMNK